MPVMDVIETAEEYIVRLEAPGIHKENLDINLLGEILTITGKREITPEIENEAIGKRPRWMTRTRNKAIEDLRKEVQIA